MENFKNCSLNWMKVFSATGVAIFRSSSIYQSQVRREFLNRRFSTKEAEVSLKVNDYSDKEYRKNLHGFNDALLEKASS